MVNGKPNLSARYHAYRALMVRSGVQYLEYLEHEELMNYFTMLLNLSPQPYDWVMMHNAQCTTYAYTYI